MLPYDMKVKSIVVALVLNTVFFVFSLIKVLAFRSAFDWRFFASLVSASIFLTLIVLIIRSNKDWLFE